MSQQIVIDNLRFARDGRLLEGSIPVAELLRTHDLLTEVSGVVTFRLQGGEGRLGRKQLQLEISGELPLRCQRCLDPVRHVLNLFSTLELIRSESELSDEDMEDDARDYIAVDKDMDVVALVEDEILLALPVVPRHEDCAPLAGRDATQGEEARKSPFAALAALKGKAS